VTIKMAKEQNLALNPVKISGICGRLMCCLSYEHDFYQGEKKREREKEKESGKEDRGKGEGEDKRQRPDRDRGKKPGKAASGHKDGCGGCGRHDRKKHRPRDEGKTGQGAGGNA
jgi:hypothetical protein